MNILYLFFQVRRGNSDRCRGFFIPFGSLISRALNLRVVRLAACIAIRSWRVDSLPCYTLNNTVSHASNTHHTRTTIPISVSYSPKHWQRGPCDTSSKKCAPFCLFRIVIKLIFSRIFWNLI